MSISKVLGVVAIGAAAIAATMIVSRKLRANKSDTTNTVSELKSTSAAETSIVKSNTKEQSEVKSQVFTELELNLREAFRVLWDNREIDGLAIEYNPSWDMCENDAAYAGDYSGGMFHTSPLIEEGSYAYCTDEQGRDLMLIGGGDCNIAVYRTESGEIRYLGPNLEAVGGAWYVFQIMDTLCDINEAVPLAAAA